MRVCWAAFLIVVLVTFPAPAQNTAARIDRIMQARFAGADFSGAVLVARESQVLYERGFGLANREWDIRTIPGRSSKSGR